VYEQYYHLNEDPFRLTPDARYAYAHASYAKARAYLEYGVQRGEGFVAVTGPPGSGKTTLIEELLTRVPPGVRVSHFVSSQLEAEDLLQMVAHAIGLTDSKPGKAMLLNQIREHLQEDRLSGRRTVLIVDEAQGLDSAALEELRLLTNLTDPRGPLLQIILLGQQQLRELLKRPELEQLRQRMIAAYHLKPMSEDDTRTYVAHRLACAQWKGDPVISDMAVRIIHHAGGGNPRRINLLCSRLLLHGYVDGKHYLTVPDVRTVLEEMEEEDLASWDDSLEEIMRAEEAREQKDESRVAHIKPATDGNRLETTGAGKHHAPDPLTTIQPVKERAEPHLEPLHVDGTDAPTASSPSRSSETAEAAGPTVPPEPAPEALPDVEVGDRLAEPPRTRVPGAAQARPRNGRSPAGWEWVVAGVLVFLLAALVTATHDPVLQRVSQWIDDVSQSITADPLSAGEESPGEEGGAAAANGEEE
jgi:type II secretory pathway predicted ATPase ExeA